MKRTIIAVVAVFMLAVTACTSPAGSGSTDPTGSTGSGLVPVGGGGVFAAGAALEPFDSCNEFLDYVKKHAIELVGPYGLPGDGGWYGPDIAFAVEEDFAASIDRAETTTTIAAGGVEGVDYSGTNVQVAGVDEPDLVKTDGSRIFVIARNRLHLIDATGSPRIVSSIELEPGSYQMFLSGDRVLVLSSGGGGYPVGALVEDVGPWHSPRTVVTEIDVSDPEEMERITTLTMDGTMLSSRMADGSVRLVMRSGPTGFDWAYPEGSGLKAERDAIEANKKIIEESTLENWVPWYVLEHHDTGTTSDGPLLGCAQVGHPDEFSGLSMLTVLTIDAQRNLTPGGGVGLLAEGQTIYASSDNLYVATGPWMVWPLVEARGGEAPDTFTTQIHQFDITNPRTAAYVASGEVEGVLLSQWSMDEYEGILRVVVTDENPWWGSSDVPETSVVALEQRGTELIEIGSVGGLGKNERVYAVRFIQDKGYVVTFRQVDPLYVVDLADPTDPTVEGELKINGYSAYLHPIGEDLLLGVGQDATAEGRVLGTQVSVFDVSDPADPRRLARLTFDDANSAAEWDHHAFLWWAPEEIAVLPLQRWSWDERSGKEDHFAGAVVVSAAPQRVDQVAEIRHPSGDPDCPECVWTPPVMRSLVIGDTIFTVSEAGVLATDMETYEPEEWLEF
ncbi:MAG: beta-propeller domain-containing protein [Acidimicrobiia bacterium]|nr:beta-propeller domain-containing protein [Acidimicrobiia bacterium]